MASEDFGGDDLELPPVPTTRPKRDPRDYARAIAKLRAARIAAKLCRQCGAPAAVRDGRTLKSCPACARADRERKTPPITRKRIRP